jgi:hypothetical protein
MQHLLKFVDYFLFFDFDFRLKIIQLLANMLQNQEEIIVKKQEQVATMDTAERRMKELRSFIFNNE